MERRIAAIFAADMVGWSRLMEADEAGTHSRRKRRRDELIAPSTKRHHGRIVKLTGDGMIAEFASVAAAVQRPVRIQAEMAAREEDVPEDKRIRCRIAVDIGNVIFDDGDVHGDGVDIAARLERLAEPGGVVVSGPACDLLKSNVEVGCEAMGERKVKNIGTPIRVHRVAPDGAPSPGQPAAGRCAASRPSRLSCRWRWQAPPDGSRPGRASLRRTPPRWPWRCPKSPRSWCGRSAT